MARTMLQLRIEALSQHLEQAQDPSVWKLTLDLPKFNVDDKLWNITVEKIHTEAEMLRGALENLEIALREGTVSECDGWRKFERVQRASEDIFRECLDLLGGLALRDRIQEEQICKLADAYIWELAADTQRRESFAIPALDARPLSTLRRVAKMQFPEWSLWTLPLVAHEYGHVVIEESRIEEYANALTKDMTVHDLDKNNPHIERQLREFNVDLDTVLSRLDPRKSEIESEPQLIREVTALVAADPNGRPDVATLPGLLEHVQATYMRQKERVRILLADALATLLAGPAYACAALLLRLNPLSVDRVAVTDHERAGTILAVLRSMNEQPAAGPPPHGNIVDKLEQYWQDSVSAARLDVNDMSSSPPPLSAPIDPETVRRHFRFYIVGHTLALYKAEYSKRAIMWSNAWQAALNESQPLAPPTLGPKEHIREALNAAWRAREEATAAYGPQQIDEVKARVELLESAALELCEQIVMERQRPTGFGDPSGSAPNLGPAPRPR